MSEEYRINADIPLGVIMSSIRYAGHCNLCSTQIGGCNTTEEAEKELTVHIRTEHKINDGFPFIKFS